MVSEMPKPPTLVSSASNGSGVSSMRAAIDTSAYGTSNLNPQSRRLAVYRLGPTLVVEGTRYA